MHSTVNTLHQWKWIDVRHGTAADTVSAQHVATWMNEKWNINIPNICHNLNPINLSHATRMQSIQSNDDTKVTWRSSKQPLVILKPEAKSFRFSYLVSFFRRRQAAGYLPDERTPFAMPASSNIHFQSNDIALGCGQYPTDGIKIDWRRCELLAAATAVSESLQIDTDSHLKPVNAREQCSKLHT